jgi:hypothetical protein
MRSRVNLVLPNRGLPDVTYPLSELTYKLLEAGDVTELTAGDIPSDDTRTLEALRNTLDKIKSEVLG